MDHRMDCPTDVSTTNAPHLEPSSRRNSSCLDVERSRDGGEMESHAPPAYIKTDDNDQDQGVAGLSIHGLAYANSSSLRGSDLSTSCSNTSAGSHADLSSLSHATSLTTPTSANATAMNNNAFAQSLHLYQSHHIDEAARRESAAALASGVLAAAAAAGERPDATLFARRNSTVNGMSLMTPSTSWAAPSQLPPTTPPSSNDQQRVLRLSTMHARSPIAPVSSSTTPSTRRAPPAKKRGVATAVGAVAAEVFVGRSEASLSSSEDDAQDSAAAAMAAAAADESKTKSGIKRKPKTRSTKACDKCREQKCRCIPDPTQPDTCSQCHLLGLRCTFDGPSHKRGPPKGYLSAVISRLEMMEDTLLAKLAAHSQEDARARDLLGELIGPTALEQVLEGRLRFSASRDARAGTGAEPLKKGSGPHGVTWHDSWWTSMPGVPARSTSAGTGSAARSISARFGPPRDKSKSVDGGNFAAGSSGSAVLSPQQQQQPRLDHRSGSSVEAAVLLAEAANHQGPSTALAAAGASTNNILGSNHIVNGAPSSSIAVVDECVIDTALIEGQPQISYDADTGEVRYHGIPCALSKVAEGNRLYIDGKWHLPPQVSPIGDNEGTTAAAVWLENDTAKHEAMSAYFERVQPTFTVLHRGWFNAQRATRDDPSIDALERVVIALSLNGQAGYRPLDVNYAASLIDTTSSIRPSICRVLALSLLAYWAAGQADDTLSRLYLSQAIVLAQSLGLHRGDDSTDGAAASLSQHLTTSSGGPDEPAARRMAWSSLLIQDKLSVASGHSPLINASFCDALPYMPSAGPHSSSAVGLPLERASHLLLRLHEHLFCLCIHLEQLCSDLYSLSPIRRPRLQEVERSLIQCSLNLHNQLPPLPSLAADCNGQDDVVGMLARAALATKLVLFQAFVLLHARFATRERRGAALRAAMDSSMALDDPYLNGAAAGGEGHAWAPWCIEALFVAGCELARGIQRAQGEGSFDDGQQVGMLMVHYDKIKAALQGQAKFWPRAQRCLAVLEGVSLSSSSSGGQMATLTSAWPVQEQSHQQQGSPAMRRSGTGDGHGGSNEAGPSATTTFGALLVSSSGNEAHGSTDTTTNAAEQESRPVYLDDSMSRMWQQQQQQQQQHGNQDSGQDATQSMMWSTSAGEHQDNGNTTDMVGGAAAPATPTTVANAASLDAIVGKSAPITAHHAVAAWHDFALGSTSATATNNSSNGMSLNMGAANEEYVTAYQQQWPTMHGGDQHQQHQQQQRGEDQHGSGNVLQGFRDRTMSMSSHAGHTHGHAPHQQLPGLPASSPDSATSVQALPATSPATQASFIGNSGGGAGGMTMDESNSGSGGGGLGLSSLTGNPTSSTTEQHSTTTLPLLSQAYWAQPRHTSLTLAQPSGTDNTATAGGGAGSSSSALLDNDDESTRGGATASMAAWTTAAFGGGPTAPVAAAAGVGNAHSMLYKPTTAQAWSPTLTATPATSSSAHYAYGNGTASTAGDIGMSHASHRNSSAGSDGSLSLLPGLRRSVALQSLQQQQQQQQQYHFQQQSQMQRGYYGAQGYGHGGAGQQQQQGASSSPLSSEDTKGKARDFGDGQGRPATGTGAGEEGTNGGGDGNGGGSGGGSLAFR